MLECFLSICVPNNLQNLACLVLALLTTICSFMSETWQREHRFSAYEIVMFTNKIVNQEKNDYGLLYLSQ